MGNEIITFEDNPLFELVYQSEFVTQKINGVEQPLRFYAPVNVADGYHLSRYIAASAQNIFSAAGCTPELLKRLCDGIIEAVNKNKLDEVAVLANNIKYRLAYPVDENAALRMAMIFHFVHGENPNTCDAHWTEWKLKKVIEDPAAYTFFLSRGINATPAYNDYLQGITQSSLEQRREALKALTPQP